LVDRFFAGERFVDFLPDDFFAPRFVDFRVVFFAGLRDDLLADFRADDFLAGFRLVFFADFRAVFFAGFRVVFFADFLAGTLSPSRRASESAIATACLRLVTFLPEPPLRSLPALRSCMTFLTFDCVFLPYFAMGSSSVVSAPGCFCT
jgi:hypothetical protein